MMSRNIPNPIDSVSDNRQTSGLSYKLPPLTFPQNQRLRVLRSNISVPKPLPKKLEVSCSGGGNGKNGSGHGSSGGGGGGWSSGSGDSDRNSPSAVDVGILGALASGWRSRVGADPQFPFKVLMEQLVGVTSSVIGDMASRPNFGMNELDFVFSTLVVGSIMNFTLMYLLAPTISAAPQTLPGIFASCPNSHMFETGSYSLINRFGTFVYKGMVFATVGFAAGLVGTAISNGLIKLRKKMDPNFETPNKPPPTVLNALTWSLHMGISSNLRYQTLNGVEFLLAKKAPEVVFKSSVIVLRCLNNILGGMTFVMLARVTGSQSATGQSSAALAPEKQKLVDGRDDLRDNQST